MYKMFIKDAWSQAPAEMKHLNSAGWIWQLIYFGAMMPIQFFIGDTYTLSMNLFDYYYSFLVPMLGSLFFVRVCPNRISKTLLLCPMSDLERKKYVYAGFEIRIIFSIVFFLVCNLPVYLVEKWKLWHLGIEFLFFLLYVITINVYVPPINPSRNSYERKYNLPGYYNIWDVLAQINGMLGMMFLVDQFRMEGKVQDFWGNLWIGIFMALQFILMLVMLLVYFKPVVEQAMQCENEWKEKKKSENRS